MVNFSFSEDDLRDSLEEAPAIEGAPVSTIGSEVVLEGRMKVKYGLDVVGTFKGSLRSNSTVKINPGGRIEGSLDAYNVSIEGEAQVSMLARKRLEVLKGGKFIGSLDVQPELIVLSEFAVFGKDEEIAQQHKERFSREQSAKAAVEQAAIQSDESIKEEPAENLPAPENADQAF